MAGRKKHKKRRVTWESMLPQPAQQQPAVHRMDLTEVLRKHSELIETGEYGTDRVSRKLAFKDVLDRRLGTYVSLRLCSNVIFRIDRKADWQTNADAIRGSYDDPRGVRVALT